jgi:hypothetical protein
MVALPLVLTGHPPPGRSLLPFPAIFSFPSLTSAYLLAVNRLMAILCRAESLREVIAFPKTATGNELMTGAPSEPAIEELKEYHISVTSPPAVPETPTATV